MWINVDDDDRDIIIAALKAAGKDNLASQFAEKFESEEDEETYIDRAKEKYAYGSDNDIEIEENGTLSVADDGVWVPAWVWLANEEDEDADDEEEEDEVTSDLPDASATAS